MTAEREALAARIRSMIQDGGPVREVAMFGGIAFMLEDRMLLSAGRDGSLLVRVDPADSEELLQRKGAGLSFMGIERPMGPGWLTVQPDALLGDEDLMQWIGVALDFHSR
ncbi:TfoX/Sxy family protein [Arthrobacter sp. D2-10]